MKRILTIAMVLWLWNLHSQSTVTYTVDEDFTTGTMLCGIGDVGDIYPLEDGGFFLSGTFNPEVGGDDNSPFERGLAMLTSSGNLHPDWGSGGVGWGLELFDHQGGYLIPAGGQTLTKVEYTGESWYDTQGDFWGDYFLFGEWGSGWDNPYNVASTWDIFIQEDQSVLIGGAIDTDTLQPGLFRHLMRLLPDGSHDDSFPIIEAMPQNPGTYISGIERASDGSWYVSGRFEGINGHLSPHIVHLTANFEVDSDFVSPLYYEAIGGTSHSRVRYIDSQDRLWVSGIRVRLDENPSDTLGLLRLLPNGELDPDFQPRKIRGDYPPSWGDARPRIIAIEESQTFEGHYIIAGGFNYYDDTLANCVTVIDDQGYIQENYFQGDGTLENQYHLDNPEIYTRPGIIALEQLPDGSLMLGGGFSEFMGVERYHLVKLNQGTVGTRDQDRLSSQLKIYPNPASTILRWNKQAEQVELYDMLGKRVLHKELVDSRNELLLDGISPGLYSIVFHTTDGIAIQKLVIQ
jgi:hypothetical protein